jgi:uncharacterized protein YcgI (DUF1989 family)
MTTPTPITIPALNTIPVGTGAGFRMKRGASLRIVDILGHQSGDLMAFGDGDPSQPLSSGRTFDYLNRVYVRPSLWVMS